MPSSRATPCASSGPSIWLMVAMMPRLKSVLHQVVGLMPSFSANSCTVIALADHHRAGRLAFLKVEDLAAVTASSCLRRRGGGGGRR